MISDEVYERFTWGEPHVSPATLDEDGRVLSVFSTSKTYAMTGARVGWLVTPPGWRPDDAAGAGVARQLRRRPRAARRARRDHRARRTRSTARGAHYRENLAAATAELDRMGLRYLTPTGAFYLWIDMSHVSDGDVRSWCERFLDEAGVAVAPGSAFGALR